MQNLRILNTREVKEIQQTLKRQWGAEFPSSFAFLMNNDNRIFIVNRDIALLDLSKLRINSLGLYIAEKMADGLRLSIEGSQLIGPNATRNIVELNGSEAAEWLKGSDIERETALEGFVILKHNADFMGCGKARGTEILNFVPKIRRLNLTGKLP